ncbi:DUF4167 domain-containing protein [Rhodovibrio sodomensis]|uniref:DUF4167 domain-containing protein n=1 Tax=Rhodovibrio sodomensis TaxID=1088 RepID=UPI0019030EA5|nr:DUF4167 domain-containing protein [Rhodovibrio sodomensis]
MRQGSSGGGRRPRGRSSGGGGGGGRKNVPLKNQNFDSNGPDVRVRGNATQVYEKYLALARDASSAGDRVIAESYYQHAEHYYRIINENTDPSYEDLYGREPNGYDGYDEDEEDDDGGRHSQARGTRQERRERYEQDERRRREQPAEGNGQAIHANGADPAEAGDGADGQGEPEGQAKPKRSRGRPRKNKNAQAADGDAGDSAGNGGDESAAATGQPGDNAASEDNA